MTLAAVWGELEERLPGDRAGRMEQRIHPESSIDLHVSVSRTGASRSLRLEVAPELVAGLELPAPTRGITMSLDPGHASRRAALSLDLMEPSAADLFTSVCADIAAVTAAAHDDEAAVGAWTGRFALWRRFLESGGGPLSARRQRGLYAELWVMGELLAVTLGIHEAVEAWKGPDGAPRDFETSGIGIEVKSSGANEPQVVPVNGERQLDDTGFDDLFIVHLSLESFRDAGETLPAMVAALRAQTHGGPSHPRFEDRLFASGYTDVHEPSYARAGYELRRTSVLRVGLGFPRITERDLPDGVGSVRYSLAIDACRSFEVSESTLRSALGE